MLYIFLLKLVVAVTRIKKLPIFFVIASLILMASIFFLTNSNYSWAFATQTPIVEEKDRASDVSKFILKIDGIDYSTLKALVWVTTGGKTLTKVIHPVSLLDPEDDGDGIIYVSMGFKKGLLKVGDSFTACIKVLQDNDKYGDHIACHEGVISVNNKSFSHSEIGRNSALPNVDNNSILVRISL